MEAEIKRLQRIIAKELSENDELGCEYTYVNALREEVKFLVEALRFSRKEIALAESILTLTHQDLADEEMNTLTTRQYMLWSRRISGNG